MCKTCTESVVCTSCKQGYEAIFSGILTLCASKCKIGQYYVGEIDN